jgi:hypothetical protein
MMVMWRDGGLPSEMAGGGKRLIIFGIECLSVRQKHEPFFYKMVYSQLSLKFTWAKGKYFALLTSTIGGFR